MAKSTPFSRNTKIRIAAVSTLGICAIVGAILEPLGVVGGYMGLGGAATMLLPGAVLAGAAWLYLKLFKKYYTWLRVKEWELEAEQEKGGVWAKIILSPFVIFFALAPIWLPILLEFTTSLNVFSSIASTIALPWVKAIENLGFMASGNPFNLILALSIGAAAGAIVAAVFLFYKDNPPQNLSAYDVGPGGPNWPNNNETKKPLDPVLYGGNTFKPPAPTATPHETETYLFDNNPVMQNGGNGSKWQPSLSFSQTPEKSQPQVPPGVAIDHKPLGSHGN